MKPSTYLSLFLVIALGISGCMPAGLATTPTQSETPVSSSTPIPPTSTSTTTPTETATATLPATLEPEQAKENIRTLLQDSVDCEAPCFWGISPGQTTLGEAINIFTHLGLQINSTTFQGKDFYGIEYEFDSGLSISVTLTIQDDFVKNLQVGIHPERPSSGGSRQWSAYSPETLISRYGSPSRVDFFLGRVAPVPTHSMDMYFEKVKLIVEYIGTNLLNTGTQLEICPLTNQVEDIYIWMGDNPQYPPSSGVPLEEATSLTLEEFSKLMMGESERACFNLNPEAFP